MSPLGCTTPPSRPRAWEVPRTVSRELDRHRQSPWLGRIRELPPELPVRSGPGDPHHEVSLRLGTLRDLHLFSAAVPLELRGGGASHAELCEILRVLAAACPLTAIAASMHFHSVASAVWRWKRGLPSEGLLRSVVRDDALVVTTSPADWLGSSGTMTRAEGGYRVRARKALTSWAPPGDLLAASARYDDPEQGPSILHFTVPLSGPGVRIESSRNTRGASGAASRVVALDDVFVPDEAIVLGRSRTGGWHPALTVAMVVSLPLIAAVYVGIAESAVASAVERARAQGQGDETSALLAGDMVTDLVAAQAAWAGLVQNAADYAFPPDVDRADAALTCETLVACHAEQCVRKAVELGGATTDTGRSALSELLLRVRAVSCHLLPQEVQQRFTGRRALGLTPVNGTETV